MTTDETRDDHAKRDGKAHDVKDEPREPSESAIDEAVEESFPASDPISVSITKKT